MTSQTFCFQPRWKEELLVSADDRSFVLELSMGVLTAHLPTETKWRQRAPRWAMDLWPILKADLAAWCEAYGARLIIEPSADVYPV
jgi:hypothetical protein